MQPGQWVFAQIVEAFGPAVVRADGSLDRKALAKLAFQHNQADALNRIVHPAVIAAEEEWMRGIFAADPERVAIVESALIFEVEKWGTAPGWVQRFDKLILVVVPDEMKISRVVSRMHGDESWAHDTQDARARMAAQIPDREKGRPLRVCHRQLGFDSGDAHRCLPVWWSAAQYGSTLSW